MTMENTTTILQDYEDIIKKSAVKKPVLLYKNSAINNSTDTCSPKEIISNVSMQLRAIQRADVSYSCKQPKQRLDKSKISTLIPVNSLPKEKEIPQPKYTTKFETQFITDTQLIDIIDNAQANADTKYCLTQELDSIFDETDFDEIGTNIKDNEPNKKNIPSSTNRTIDKNNKQNEYNSAQHKILFKNIEHISEVGENSKCVIDNHFNRNINEVAKTQFKENNEMFNKCLGIESNFKSIEEEDIDIPSSYVFEPIEPKSKIPSPLVFDLNTFESFESIALPIIEENEDLNIAKHLINSQIIGKELLIQSHIQEFKSSREMSPVLKISKNNLRITKNEQANVEFNENDHKDGNDFKVRDKSSFLKDEILFSSDEESEYVHKEVEDLPLTCALETSFYDQPDMLDKTLYVGFQTASNKSIQVSAESFTKARSILEGIDKDITSKASLTELVNICDSLSKTSKTINVPNSTGSGKQSKLNFSDIELDMSLEDNIIGGIVESDECNVRALENEIILPDSVHDAVSNIDKTNINSLKDKEYVFKKPMLPVKRKFNGFITASNKKIKLSEQALERCKTVFKDIDLDDKLVCDKEIHLHVNCIKSEIEKTDNSSVDCQHIDEVILKEFSNDMSLIEQEKRKTVEDIISFKAASNKNISISEAGLSKMKTTFEGIDFEDKYDKNNLIIPDNAGSVNIIKSEMCNLVGYKTASNKCIKISEFDNVPETTLSKEVVRELKNVGHILNLTNKSKLEQSTFICRPNKTAAESKTMDLKEMSEEVQDVSCVGFKTASNKQIRISEKALARSKYLFKDEELFKTSNETSPSSISFKTNAEESFKNEPAPKENCNFQIQLNKYKNISYSDCNTNEYPEFTGFLTANRKTINISAKALAKSRELFKDIESEDTLAVIDKLHKSSTERVSELKGFQKSTKMFIGTKISAENLTKSKAVFQNVADSDFIIEARKPIDKITETCNEKCIEQKNALYKVEPKFKGFQTASKKPIQISADALYKSKFLFNDIDVQTFEDIGINKDIRSPLKGYQTASSKPVYISEVAKSKALIEEFGNTKESAFIGFQTANKKAITVSAEALAKSKTLFKDIDNDQAFEFKQNSSNINKVCGLNDFQTASRQPDNISEEALATSKSSFDELDNKDEHALKGFQTANKNQISISPEALAKRKVLFKDFNEDKTFEEIESHSDRNEVSGFKGFHTASNKPVEISAEALAKSKAILENEVKDNPNPKFQGFLTGHSKSVSVPEEASIKSKRLFENIDSNTNKSTKMQSQLVFQTAGNKKVNVSEEALKRSRQLFQDIEFNHCKENLQSNNPKDYVTNVEEHRLTTKNLLKARNDNDFNVSKDALAKSNKIQSTIVNSTENHLEMLIDTQVIENFDQTLHTEDFLKVITPRSKRSGSPILSCPKAKKRKRFETPYRNEEVVAPKSFNVPVKQDNTMFRKDYKKKKMLTLKDIAVMEEKYFTKQVDSYIKRFRYDNLLSFEFSGTRNDCDDLVLTTEDVKSRFNTSVDRKLVPEGWVDNHLKLILWKLISYELKFTNTMSQVCTARNVLDQLKFRYDKELYNAERPAIRKILERDDVPSKAMVLCVAEIYEDGVSVASVKNIASTIELLLTDGWYTIKASIDKMLTKLVYDGKIVAGTKIVTNGAEIANCEQGVSPWEDTSSVRLKIFGNSTRRARWHTRLGYHGNGAILPPLSTVRPEGGKVPRLRLLVARVYPALYVEKFEDGSTVTRSERLEHIHQNRYEMERQNAMEKLYEEVEKELSDQDSQDSQDRRSLDTPYQCTKTHCPTNSFEDRTNKRREIILQNIQRKVQEKLEKYKLDGRRNVVPLLKVRVAGVREIGDNVEVTKGFMSIWKPNEDITEIVKEGAWIEVMNVVPTAIRYSEIQISAGRQSVFRRCKYKEKTHVTPYIESLSRKCYTIRDLAKNPTISTDYGEIDTVGTIFLIDPSFSEFESTKHSFQNIYLADPDKNIICVNFWGGVKKFGYQNVLDTGQIVACMNLQKRAGNTRKCIPQFRVTEFSYFTKTPKNVNTRNVVAEIVKNMSGLDIRKFCDECVVLKNNFSIKNLNENISPYRFKEHNISNNKIFIESSLAQAHKTNKLEDNFNLTGLDFESTFKQTDTQELSPHALLRKKKVDEKIQKLKMYGEPPELSPIHIINKSKSVLNSYKSPLAITSGVTMTTKCSEGVGNDDSEIQSSPILSMNRTYVKNVNPVKLNFNVQDNSVDDFAEEFDGSPPLSLD